ncbi:hypothetical protein Syun_009411 [Stephania yunnanensis]|uniref:Enhancer of polycomb-like protein n=1 Tax=Stephania yunnanensis TaxID=152371 RepID=A0AAP0PP07_9MAGN
MSRLSFRPRPLDIHKKLPIVKSVKDFEDEDTPTTASTTSTRNSQLLRLAAEADNEVQQVTIKKSVSEIPTPQFVVVDSYERDYSRTFSQPTSYLRGRGARAELGEFVEYDLDNEDEDWLVDFNNERKIITPEKLENLLFKLEVLDHKTRERAGVITPTLGSPIPVLLQLEAAYEALQSLSVRYAIFQSVYNYWKAKRERWQKPVLRRLQASMALRSFALGWKPPPPVNDTNPYNVFRPREKAHRLHTRRMQRRENNVQSFEKLRQINIYVLSMVSEQSSKMEARLDDMETRMGRIEKEVKMISAIEDSMKELRSEMKLMFRGLAQMIEELLQQSSLQHIPTTMMNAISSLKEFVAPNFHPSSAKQMETTRPPQVQLPGSQSLLYYVKSISHVSSHNGGFGSSTMNLDKSDLPILEITPSITTPTPMHLDFNTPPPPSPQYPPNLPHTFICNLELRDLLWPEEACCTIAPPPWPPPLSSLLGCFILDSEVFLHHRVISSSGSAVRDLVAFLCEGYWLTIYATEQYVLYGKSILGFLKPCAVNTNLDLRLMDTHGVVIYLATLSSSCITLFCTVASTAISECYWTLSSLFFVEVLSISALRCTCRAKDSAPSFNISLHKLISSHRSMIPSELFSLYHLEEKVRRNLDQAKTVLEALIKREEKKREVMECEVSIQRIQMKYKNETQLIEDGLALGQFPCKYASSEDDFADSDDMMNSRQRVRPASVHNPIFTDSKLVMVPPGRLKQELRSQPLSHGWLHRKDPNAPVFLFTRPVDPEKLAAAGIRPPSDPPLENGGTAPLFRFRGRIGRGGRIIFDRCNSLLQNQIGHDITSFVPSDSRPPHG